MCYKHTYPIKLACLGLPSVKFVCLLCFPTLDILGLSVYVGLSTGLSPDYRHGKRSSRRIATCVWPTGSLTVESGPQEPSVQSLLKESMKEKAIDFSHHKWTLPFSWEFIFVLGILCWIWHYNFFQVYMCRWAFGVLAFLTLLGFQSIWNRNWMYNLNSGKCSIRYNVQPIILGRFS